MQCDQTGETTVCVLHVRRPELQVGKNNSQKNRTAHEVSIKLHLLPLPQRIQERVAAQCTWSLSAFSKLQTELF